jgi:hypothetical protein
VVGPASCSMGPSIAACNACTSPCCPSQLPPGDTFHTSLSLSISIWMA